MKLTVSLRIFGGFAVLLMLSVIIYLVALMGINNIGGDIEKVTKRSVPALVAGAELSQNILISELSLVELATSNKRGDANKLRDLINQANDANQAAQSDLFLIVQKQPSLAPLFNDTKALNSTFINGTNDVINDYFKMLDYIDKAQEKAREFGDMGDEVLSLAYDLEGLSDDDTVNDTITTFVSFIENAADEANSALASNITFEILSIQSSLQDSNAELKKLFSQFSNDPALQEEEAVTTMAENLERFSTALVGEQSAIKARLESLKQKQQVLKNLKKAKDLGDDTRGTLVKLNNAIREYTALVQQAAANSVSKSQTIITVLAVITFVLSSLVAYFVTLTIKKPLQLAVEQIKRAATGDMTVTFTKVRNDELGELADNMQSLIDTLRSTLKEIIHNSNSLATTAEQTQTIAAQSFNSASDQDQKMQMMSTSIAEMTDTVQSVTTSVHNTLEEVEKASIDAEKGQALLSDNVNNITKLASAIKHSANAIEKLNDDTNNISSVLDVIRGVAEQTNLLALNAAIEAARAGEQGRGFAVVADEVRTLASRAHDATQEIQQAIERLQVGAKQAVETMSQSQQETELCVDGIQSVDGMLHSILSGITNIKDMSQQIATASEQQSISALNQNENVKEIKTLTELSTSHAEENNQASQQLASMAETQRELMSKFKT